MKKDNHDATHKDSHQIEDDISLERRKLLKLSMLGLVQISLAPLSGCASFSARGRNTCGHLEYFLHDGATELFLSLEARGFCECNGIFSRSLRLDKSADPRIILTFPPQHYLETAIPFAKILPVNGRLTVDQIKSLRRSPAQPTRLVFKPTEDFKKLELKLEELLKFTNLELVLPDHASYGDYVPGRAYNDDNPETYIEIPWGIVFSPKSPNTQALNLVQQLSDASLQEWKPIWNMMFQNASSQIELAGVTGFTATQVPGQKLVDIVSDNSIPDMAWADGAVPLVNCNRLEIIANLSGRFKYNGDRDSNEQTTQLRYSECDPNKTIEIKACYEPGREVGIKTLILSSNGAWLEVDSSWEAPPGCGVTAWTHSAAMGRDQHVKMQRRGFLYPFGTEATLITQSERIFLKDPAGTYLAVLIKQSYLEIPQPNAILLKHNESPLRSISITTKRTPPLDLPPSGDPADWEHEDHFVPMVDGTPFMFAHVGTDWAGTKHHSFMAHVFVNDKMRSPNGRIHEPNYIGWNGSPAKNLRDIDRDWMLYPHRFAYYNGNRMALAQPMAEGDTTQRVDWIEWVRGPIGSLHEGPVVLDPPFIPRLRTARIRLESTGPFSGNNTAVIGCYRDTRFVDQPFLDPEPNAPTGLYNTNVANPAPSQRDALYFFILETQPVIHLPENSKELPDNDRKQAILDSYHGTRGNSRVPLSLFENVQNEIRFGRDIPADKSGALAVPDTHAVGLSRQFGVTGDATFNVKRWCGFAHEAEKLQARGRLDFATFRQRYRNQLDVNPFDATIIETERKQQIANAKSIMGLSALDAGQRSNLSRSEASLMSLGEVFGADAELIPGISFAKVFETIVLDDGTSNSLVDESLLLRIDGKPRASSSPFKWNVAITGIDWLMELIGEGPDQISVPDLITISQKHGQDAEVSTELEIGFTASVDWEARNFPDTDVDFGVAIFRAKDNAAAKISARAESAVSIDQLLGQGFDASVRALSPRLSASATVENVAVEVFRSIEVEFSRIDFELDESGDKNFSVDIGDVTLLGPLAFINQLSSALSSVGDDYGVDIDIAFDGIVISQTLKFPEKGGAPLFIGPAQVIDLALGWAVRVPFVGRDVISVSFAISSRRRPLTIYVPPWYGGKAYFLIELTTKGVRTLELSMEYGALVPITWGIATGQASFTAGLFYGVKKQINADGKLTSGTVTFTAFVRAGADLDVASIIHFSGWIYIALSVVDSGSDAHKVSGEATISVSIKIGFVRLSYSFTAKYEENRRQGGEEQGDLARRTLPESLLRTRTHLPMQASTVDAEIDGDRAIAYVSLYGKKLSSSQQSALDNIVAGFH